MVEHDVDIDSLFEPGAESALEVYLRLLHPADIAELFNFVERENWTRITQSLSSQTLAELLTHLDENQRERLGELLKPEQLVRAVDALETDDAADVVADLPEGTSEFVLARLEDKADIKQLLAYPDDSAGGIMQKELCRVRDEATVVDAIDAVRATRERVDDVLEVYVVDDKGHLLGTVRLEDLVLSKPHTPISRISKPVEHSVTPDQDQELVAQEFRKYDLVTLPVVDGEGVLLGRITFDDIHDVLEEEASEDLLAVAGASSDEVLYAGSSLRVALFRLPWLASSFLGSMITGFLLSLFGTMPGDAIIKASFVPMVMAMTGNVGTQSAMIITRGFAIGKIELGTLSKTFGRELGVGLSMGVAAGCVASVVGLLWRGDPALGLSVGLAMVCSMTAAACLGVLFPTIFKRLGIDPAIAAGPIVTTGCDIMAVGIYLLLALLVHS